MLQLRSCRCYAAAHLGEAQAGLSTDLHGRSREIPEVGSISISPAWTCSAFTTRLRPYRGEQDAGNAQHGPAAVLQLSLHEPACGRRGHSSQAIGEAAKMPPALSCSIATCRCSTAVFACPMLPPYYSLAATRAVMPPGLA